ncbi:biopolymer transport ExbD protein [Alcanivorax sp. 521-1]|uniref:Biopolymer transport protein ExbD n=1 Tax=Alloalcanivorax profundimaris TaxID=2735259 RepID=A0ABS0AMA2_9GAMM|nr:TonB system transport protein ExbD [Alloalcanivorax profundimaris]MBF5055208.1 biopolymer transport ExbD protein [Alloalcanivorax profundimaris]
MGMRIDQDDELAENHEINVTPFIDVMLVLLIIFMVAAPLATVDIKVDLPAASATPEDRPDDPLYLTLAEDHTLTLGETPVAEGGLAAALAAASGGREDPRIFLRADSRVDYQTLMGTLDRLREAGYLKVALVAREGPGGSAGDE